MPYSYALVQYKREIFSNYILISLSFLLLSLLTSAFAQTGAEIHVTSGFQPDPLIYEYISGGGINATESYGEACKGFISSEPDHILYVDNAMDYMRVYVQSAADTTMVVLAVDSNEVVCSDDVIGTNPQVARAWPVGVYHIYIGSFDDGDLANYKLFISENSN